MYIKPKFKVLDLYNGVVIDSDETPVVNGTKRSVKAISRSNVRYYSKYWFNDFNELKYTIKII